MEKQNIYRIYFKFPIGCTTVRLVESTTTVLAKDEQEAYDKFLKDLHIGTCFIGDSAKGDIFVSLIDKVDTCCVK